MTQLKNWWMRRKTLFKLDVDVCILSIRAEVVILDCRLGGELELSPIMRWLFRMMPYRGPKTWRRHVGKHKVLETQLAYDGCLSTGFCFARNMHCAHGGYRFGFGLLGATCELNYYDMPGFGI